MSDTTVVLGATGGIGREIVARLLAEGHRVAAVARNAERLQALADRHAEDRLAIVPGSVATDAEAEKLVRALREQRRKITAVVASLRGTPDSGRLLERSGPSLLETLNADVVAHFVAARHLLPLLAESRPGGIYLLLGGPMTACAWSGYGHLSIAASALQMLTRVLREEAKDLNVIVQQLQVGTPVRTESNAKCACPEWLRADEVAHRVAGLIQHRNPLVPVVEFGGYRQIPIVAAALRGAVDFPAPRSTNE